MTTSDAPASPPRLRAGTAARLAGLPVTTLRVWERRYGVVAPMKSESGQRLYSLQDVSRLRSIRQLTQSGHAVGTIATLSLEALQSLAAGGAKRPTATGVSTLTGVVVGRSAALGLEAMPGCRVRAVHDDLDAAESAIGDGDGDGAAVGWLLVRLASLQPGAVERVLALGARLRAEVVLVVYAYGAEASVRALRDAGAQVLREPVSALEVWQWLRRSTAETRPDAAAGVEPHIEPRRFGDEALARLAGLPSPVACECLRHLTELVAQLAGFERYSQECGSSGPADAALHRRLSQTAGAARTLFEQALQHLLDVEGLALPEPVEA